MGRDTHSEHGTFILPLMRQARGHEAVPKMLRESWHEQHPSFLLKAECLHGVEQMDLQKPRCVSVCPFRFRGWLLFDCYFSNAEMIFTVLWLLQRNLASGFLPSTASPPGLAFLSVSMSCCLLHSLRIDGPF